MKNTIYFLAILILFQSCYAYKAFDLKNHETIKPKKVKIELKNSSKVKGNITKINNDKIVLKKINETVEISITDIEKIKGRKFSYLKTIGLTYGIALTALIILLGVLLNGF